MRGGNSFVYSTEFSVVKNWDDYTIIDTLGIIHHFHNSDFIIEKGYPEGYKNPLKEKLPLLKYHPTLLSRVSKDRLPNFLKSISTEIPPNFSTEFSMRRILNN